MKAWIHRTAGRLGPVVGLTVLLVVAFGSTSIAQPSTCELLAPWELTEATAAAFGAGEGTEATCTWRTETRDGHILTITLDVSTIPPTVTIETDDPSLDTGSIASMIAALAAERVASGDAAPIEPPADPTVNDRPDLCALFPAEEIAGLLGVAVKPYGSQGASICGYLGDEPGRVLIDVSVAFGTRTFADILRDWPDAVETQVAGLPALEYGWDLGSSQTSYISVDTDAGLLTANVTFDADDPDPTAVARALVDEVLSAMGYATS